MLFVLNGKCPSQVPVSIIACEILQFSIIEAWASGTLSLTVNLWRLGPLALRCRYRLPNPAISVTHPKKRITSQ